MRFHDDPLKFKRGYLIKSANQEEAFKNIHALIKKGYKFTTFFINPESVLSQKTFLHIFINKRSHVIDMCSVEWLLDKEGDFFLTSARRVPKWSGV